MAALPNKSFLVNWNARNYDAATHTIAKESGQLFDHDLVFPNAVSAYTDTYVTLPSSGACKTTFSFSSSADNPFNLYSGDSFTLIAKMKPNANESWCISNRDSSNYWLLGFNADILLLSSINDYTSPHLYYTPLTTGPLTMGVRISNNYGEYISVTDNTTVGAQLSGSWWQNPTKHIYFFGGNSGSEIWTGDLYWLYISKEALTDAEIAQVVAYNENATTFEPSQDSFSFNTQGGTASFTVTADNAWMAAAPTDFTISPLSGSAGDTTVTITAPMRLTTKTNTVTFTDSEQNTFDITIAQSDQGINPNLTMYKGSTTIKKMYYGTDLVYRKMAHSPSLTLSVDSLSIDPNGGSGTFTVTTNGTFTATTEDSWITLSTSGTTVTVTATSTQDNRSGSITVTATNGFVTKTATVAVSQSVAQLVSYIHTQTMSSHSGKYIYTGITLTVDTEVRVKAQYRGYVEGGTLVGGYSTDPSYGENNEWRMFYVNNQVYYDANDRRATSGYKSFSTGDLIDYTISNYSVYDNNTSTNVINATQYTTVPECTIIVSVGSWWLQELEIIQGGVTVFDGKAAVSGSDIGLFDSVSNQMVVNPDLTMAYEA